MRTLLHFFRIPLLLILPLALLMGGCSVTYPVIGSFDDYNEVFIGEVHHNLSTGTHYVTATGQVTGITCKGPGKVTYIPNMFGCSGQQGVTNLICSDGRTIEAQWIAESCTTGFGNGVDKEGNKFSFTFGMKQDEAMTRIKEEMKQADKRPDMPTYNPKQVRKEKGFSTGTGFFINTNGVFVTNYHVIEDSDQITLIDTNGKAIEARILALDKANDVAILKADITSTPIPLAARTHNRIGDEVFTLGYPMIKIQGQNVKATFGRINALSGIQDDVRFLQIDVPIQPGNSGGPLLNTNGEVVGIVTMTLDQINALKESGHIPQNVNFASKIDYTLPLLGSNMSITDVQIGDIQIEYKIPEIVERYSNSVFLVVAR